VQREVRELVAQGARQVVLIGAQQDGARAGLGDRRPPGGSRARCERFEGAAVGNYDQSERRGVAPTEPRPVGGSVGGAREVEREGPLGGPGDGGDPAYLDGGRRALKEEGER
jgi:hypothetical protein